MTGSSLGLFGSLLGLFFIFVPCTVAFADYYKYTDASGAVNITNKLESVPQKYRSRVKVITDEKLNQKDLGARKAVPESVQEDAAPAKEEAAPAPRGKFAELGERFAWFKPLVYLAGVFAALLVVIKIAALVPSAMLARLIYLSFFIGVSAFLYKVYIDHMVAESIAVKNKAVNMMKKSMVREMPLPGEAPAAGGQGAPAVSGEQPPVNTPK